MNSREKITLLIDELPELLPTGGMDMAVLRLAAVELGPKLASMLPQDPERLDQLLLDFAAQVLAMRSDTAPAAAIARGGAELPLDEGPEGGSGPVSGGPGPFGEPAQTVREASGAADSAASAPNGEVAA